MKKVAVLQSNYIPWKGYFDLIAKVDEFIFHDDLQYTKSDWRNRNKIKTDQGTEWLSVPCGSNTNRLICEVEIESSDWQQKHWRKIKNYYTKAPHWKFYSPFFEELYLGTTWKMLSKMNMVWIKKISQEIFGFTTTFRDSREFNLETAKAERLIELLKKAEATYYLSGPAAKDYISDNDFEQEGMAIEWMDYSNYKTYHQLYPPFVHEVTILDLLFNEGEEAINYLKVSNQP